MKNSLVSVIIVNYNGKRWLEGCLGDLAKQDYKSTEIIVVDNGSSDGSIEFISHKYPVVEVVKLKANKGFAEGNNLGFEKSRGEMIIFLNNDTRVNSNFISSFVSVFDKIPNCGVAQSKIVLLKDKNRLDSCGSFFTTTTFQYYLGNGKSANLDKYNREFPVFSTKGASMIVKREVIEKIGLFNADFWSYYEETDFCHRAWLAGYQVWYWPYTVTRHAVGGTSLLFQNDLVQFHNFKNKLASLLINLGTESLFIYLPVYLFFTMLITIGWVLSGKMRHGFGIIKSLGWNLYRLPKTLGERRLVQSFRVNSDQVIFSQVLKNPKLYYYRLLFLDRLSEYVD